jgi:hypothetical protein
MLEFTLRHNSPQLDFFKETEVKIQTYVRDFIQIQTANVHEKST